MNPQSSTSRGHPSSTSRDREGAQSIASDRSLTVAARLELRDALTDSLRAQHERLIRLRRRLHASPERSGAERETTALVAETLRESGFEPRVMADGIGVIAELEFDARSKSFIALRAELDSVGVNDDKQIAYASTRPGLCHACGHDVHTTITLAAASVLKEHRTLLARLQPRHNLRFIFQPAEETATGARSMIKQGALNGVDSIIALHVDPFLEVGKFGFRIGPLTSAFRSFRVVIRGKSGHSARPFEAIDPIPAATTIVDLFYQLGPRSMDNRYPLSLTVGSIQAGQVFNAIPDQAIVLGTLRAARLVDLEAVQNRMHAVVKGAAEATGCEIDLEFVHDCPATNNDESVVSVLAGVAGALFGQNAIEWIEVPSLGGEDFSFYLEHVPGAMIRLGAAPAELRARRPLHSGHFDINEDAIEPGALFLCSSALALATGAATLRKAEHD